jgi:hypothetical protein
MLLRHPSKNKALQKKKLSRRKGPDRADKENSAKKCDPESGFSSRFWGKS